jgi:hypothetical protein
VAVVPCRTCRVGRQDLRVHEVYLGSLSRHTTWQVSLPSRSQTHSIAIGDWLFRGPASIAVSGAAVLRCRVDIGNVGILPMMRPGGLVRSPS